MLQEEKIYELIAQQLAGEINEADQTELQSWVAADAENQKTYEEIVQLWQVSELPAVNFESNKETAWNNIDQRIDDQLSTNKKTATVRRLPIYRVAGIAASILLLVFAGWWLTQQEKPVDIAFATETFSTTAKERLEIMLPDSSVVWLNENTTLSYQTPFDQRIVALNGEAFFDVTKREGRTFEIQSGTARTVVLGTSFNVRAYPNEAKVEVVVKTGKVALSSAVVKEKKVLIPAGSSATLDKNTKQIEEKEVTTTNADAWQTRQLKFKNTPIREVIPTLERYFNIEVDVNNDELMNCRVNSKFDEPNLEEILTILEVTLQIKADQQDGKYLLSGKGCTPSNK